MIRPQVVFIYDKNLALDIGGTRCGLGRCISRLYITDPGAAIRRTGETDRYRYIFQWIGSAWAPGCMYLHHGRQI